MINYYSALAVIIITFILAVFDIISAATFVISIPMVLLLAILGTLCDIHKELKHNVSSTISNPHQ